MRSSILDGDAQGMFLSVDEAGKRGVFKELVASALLEYNKIRQGQIGKGESSTLGKLHIHGIDGCNCLSVNY